MDLDGNILDVCYRFNFQFNPPEALKKIDTNRACITKCCWASDVKVTQLDFNKTFVNELVNQGKAVKYTPDNIVITVSYSPVIRAVHGKITPKDIVTDGNIINMGVTEVNSPQTVSKVAADSELTEREYPEDPLEDGYLYKTNRNERGAVFGKKLMTTSTTIEADGTVSRTTVVERKKTPMSRQKALNKMLAQERQQAVKLVKRFFDQDIDAYIMAIDKSKRSQGLVLLANKRNWETVKTATDSYEVTCKVEGQLGKDLKTMQPHPIDCGVYQADLANQKVAPKDIVAKAILDKTYYKR